MTQRSLLCCADNSFLQQYLQLVDQREVGAASYDELHNAGILAAGAVQLLRQLLVQLHGLVDGFRQRAVLLLCQLIQLSDNIVR